MNTKYKINICNNIFIFLCLSQLIIYMYFIIHSDNNMYILRSYYFYVIRKLLLTNYFVFYFNKNLNILSITKIILSIKNY